MAQHGAEASKNNSGRLPPRAASIACSLRLILVAFTCFALGLLCGFLVVSIEPNMTLSLNRKIAVELNIRRVRQESTQTTKLSREVSKDFEQRFTTEEASDSKPLVSTSQPSKSPTSSPTTAFRPGPDRNVEKVEWVWRGKNSSLCQLYVCSPDGYTANIPALSRNDACAELLKRNITKIRLGGDSFVRHLYVALVLWLSGNYKDGGLKPQHDKVCLFGGQFEEKQCRLQLGFQKTICNGRIHVSLGYAAWYRPTLQDLVGSDIMIWSGGNHPTTGVYGCPPNTVLNGQNHAGMVDKAVLSKVCIPSFRQLASKKLFWVHPHEHIVAHCWYETNTYTGLYVRNMNMKLQTTCDIPLTHILEEPRRITSALLNRTEANDMTYDGMHWGMEVNLLKIQSAILSILKVL